jgi:hypothetical protein
MTAMAEASSNCKQQTYPLVREVTRIKKQQLSVSKENWFLAPDTKRD